MSNTFNETHFDFDESTAALNDQIQEFRDKADDLDDDNSQKDTFLAKAQQLESQRKGAVWARDRAAESDDFPQWDDDVDGVTLAALRAGAYGGLEDDLQQDPNAGSGTSTNLLVAEGTVDAPYVNEGMTDAQRAGAVAQLHPFYRKWAVARINELMDPEQGNGIRSETSPEGPPIQTTSTDE